MSVLNGLALYIAQNSSIPDSVREQVVARTELELSPKWTADTWWLWVSGKLCCSVVPLGWQEAVFLLQLPTWVAKTASGTEDSRALPIWLTQAEKQPCSTIGKLCCLLWGPIGSCCNGEGRCETGATPASGLRRWASL